MFIRFKKEKNNELTTQVEKVWDLDTVGIKNNEISVYEQLMKKVKCIEGHYEVRSPFKEEH